MAQTFDDIELHRPDLARGYLSLLRAQPGRPLALFAPRRVGKTFFLAEDVTPISRRAGFLPVYADLWLHRAAPLHAINHALEEALDDELVPTSAVKRAARTAVSQVGAFGASVSLDKGPKRKSLPDEPGLRLDALVSRLAAAANKPILLMLDEFQALADVPSGADAIASLRAVLQKRKRDLFAICTGSSQEALAAMITSSGGPMYQFVQLLDFPALGDEFLELLAARFSVVHRGKRLDLDALRAAFDRIGHKPGVMKDLVKAMSADGQTDPQLALRSMLRDERYVAGWRAQLGALSPLEVNLLHLLARGLPPFAKASLDSLRDPKKTAVTIGKVRSALARLKRAGLVRPSAGGYSLDDPLMADYLSTLD